MTRNRNRKPISKVSVDKEIERIDAWLTVTGMKPSRLGLLACANARAVDRVKAGTGSVESLRALLDYIDKHPADSAMRNNG